MNGAPAESMGIRHRLKTNLALWKHGGAGGEVPLTGKTATRATLEWLCLAQNATGSGGFSRAFSLITGWDLPYPETTGYIIPTLLAHDGEYADLDLGVRAKRAGEWLADVQFASGAICSKQWKPDTTKPSVFNTGMVLHGWVSLLELNKQERIWNAAHRAVKWMIEQQEPDGSWVKGAYNGIAHSYYTMAAWALLRFSELARDVQSREAAVKNLEWALRQQHANGWFDRCWFSPDDAVTTHTLSYTTQGLVESGRILGDRKFIEAAARGTMPLRKHYEASGKLCGAFDPDWRPIVNWQCCTGNAQTAIVWRALAKVTDDRSWNDAADRIGQQLLKFQRINCRVPGINGAIPGSWPITGGYDTLAFPNHAAKFYIDALSAA